MTIKGKNQEQGKEGKGPGEQKEEKMYKVSKLVQCGYVWEFNSDTQEYKCFSKAEDGALKIKGANIKGRDDWCGIMKVYKGTGKWLNDGQELAAHLEAEKESEIEKRVEERMRAKEEEAWKSTPGSHAGHDDDDNWDWDGPQWSNEPKELNADKKHQQWEDDDEASQAWWYHSKQTQ